jgi:hypothetical protein
LTISPFKKPFDLKGFFYFGNMVVSRKINSFKLNNHGRYTRKNPTDSFFARIIGEGIG